MSAPIRVLELRSVRGTGGGPEKTILLGAARSDPTRFAVTVCYIRDRRDTVFALDDRARKLGVDYVEVHESHSFDRAIWPALRRLVRDRRIDIVHAHEHKTDLLALLLARAEGVRPLATAHGWSGLTARERFYYFFDRRLLARYPLVVAVSRPIADTLVRHGLPRDRVRHIPNGIDHREFRREAGARESARRALGIPDAALVAGAVGRLEEVKRFDLLIEAAAGLRTERPVFVVLVGEGSLREQLTACARASGLGERVVLTGHRDDAKRLHQAFDVYVQSSDSEGIPNAVLEAMALETPVVATNVGGTGELIDDGVHGLLAPKGNVDALRNAISRTWNERNDTARRVGAARHRIEHELSFDERMRRLEAVYQELMESSRAAAEPRSHGEHRHAGSC